MSWSNEIFLESWFSHYRNGHLCMPILDTPSWIIEGMNVFSLIVRMSEDEHRREEQKAHNYLKPSI
jgi:hypothetical protein